MIAPPPSKSPHGAFAWDQWFLSVYKLLQFRATLSDTDPTTTDVPENTYAVYKNTTTGVCKLWMNDNNTMKSVTFT